jgi:hypothetical protein
MIKHGYVYHGLMDDAAQVGDRLKEWFAGDDRAYQATFRPDDRVLDWFDSDQAQTLVAEWDEGRVFSDRREVRWRKEGKGYAVWLLCEEGNQPGDLGGLSEVEAGTEGWQVVDRTALGQSIYLWGQYKKQEEAWVEVRLPRRLRYPVKDEVRLEDAFVRVGHMDYRSPNGAVQFTRLTEVR